MSRYTMKLIFILILKATVIIYSKCDGKVRENNMQRLLRAIREIVESKNIHDVIILIEDFRKDVFMEQVYEMVSKDVLHFRPAVCVRVPNQTIWRNRTDYSATSRSLIIYIYGTHSMLQSREHWNIINNTLSVCHEYNLSNLLLLLLNDETDNSIELLLTRMWSKQILQAVVLEIRGYDWQSNKLNMTVNQYNPFTNNYTRIQDYASVTTWFPDKLRNMNGYKISIKTYDEDDNPDGTSLEFEIFRLQAFSFLAETMNFTFQPTNGTSPIDVYINTQNLLSGIDRNFNYPILLAYGRLSLLVPVLQKNSIILWQFLGIVLLGMSIIVICFLLSMCLKVNERLFQPLTVVCLLIGASITNVPKTVVEKILILCLDVVYTRFSSMFYFELFNLALIDDELNIATFEDLEKSELSVITSTVYAPEIMSTGQVSATLKKRFVVKKVYDIVLPLVREKKLESYTSYMLESTTAQLVLQVLRQHHEEFLRISDLYLTTEQLLFAVEKRSPYIERFNEILLQAVAIGFAENATRIMQGALERQKINHFDHQQRNENFIVKLIPFLALFSGYVLAFLTFVGEIIANIYVTYKAKGKTVSHRHTE